MTDRTIGFIGGGRVATIILGGWARAKALPANILVADADQKVLARLKDQHGSIETVGTDIARAAAQDIVLLALHPPAIPETLARVASSLKSDAILASLAPKLTITKLSGLLKGFRRIARMIPNAPSIVGAGYNPVAFGEALSADDRAVLVGLLSALGECPEVDEAKLEAYAIVTAMGPTYFWPQFYELMSLAQSFGLSPAEAAEGLHQMIDGTIRTMRTAGLSPEQVQDLIPVKPLADLNPTIVEAYRTKLRAVMEKFRP